MRISKTFAGIVGASVGLVSAGVLYTTTAGASDASPTSDVSPVSSTATPTCSDDAQLVAGVCVATIDETETKTLQPTADATESPEATETPEASESPEATQTTATGSATRTHEAEHAESGDDQGQHAESGDDQGEHQESGDDRGGDHESGDH